MTKMMTCFYFNNTKTGFGLRPSLYFNVSNHVAYTWTTNNTKTGVGWRPSLYFNASNHMTYTWNHKKSKDGYLDKTVFGIYILKSRGYHVKVLTKTKTVSPEHCLCIVVGPLMCLAHATVKDTKTVLSSFCSSVFLFFLFSSPFFLLMKNIS